MKVNQREWALLHVASQTLADVRKMLCGEGDSIAAEYAELAARMGTPEPSIEQEESRGQD